MVRASPTIFLEEIHAADPTDEESVAQSNLPAEFLSDVELRPYELPPDHGLTPSGLALGRGSQGVEIALATAEGRPRAGDLRRAWLKRQGGRAAPLLLVAFHDGKATVCGPSGDKPRIYRDLEPDQVERLCRSALDSPDRHAALSLLRDALPEAETAVPGLKNSGLLATHELENGVPKRPDWGEAAQRSRPLLTKKGRQVLTGMGYEVEPLPGPASVLVADGTRQAVAVFLDQDESIEVSSQRFAGLSPVSYALAQADQHHLPWVIVARGGMLRLYSTEAGMGVASRGQTETFVQLRLALLREEQAGYLWLLFSPEALEDEGTLAEILAASEDYAADLSSRLRERIYDEVVPDLAEAIARARDLKDPSQEELEETYEITLLLLYRLLFVAYAEDRRLLPYETNESYRSRSLKEKARELLRIVQEAGEFDDSATHWREVTAVFRAVRDGNTEWDVPQYDGTLFATNRELSQAGAVLGDIELSNKEFGPPLSKLLLDKGPEGLGPIDFRSLGVREFGTIYEGLLEAELSVADQSLTVDDEGEYLPADDEDKALVQKGEVYLHDTSGRRKSTGTFYTKTFAVEHLLEHALEPALNRHLEELTKLDETEAAERFFDFRVADIAMGSGHFLIAAVDHIERRFRLALERRNLPGVQAELQRLRQKAAEQYGDPSIAGEIEDSQLLRRQIARRCIYGVDLNSVAVQLARLSLWIHTFVPGLPLSFLDHGIVEGNSLLGIATLVEAHEALGLLDEQIPAWAPQAADLFDQARDAVERLGHLSDADASEIRQAREAQREIAEKEAPYQALFDILTAARIDDELREELAQGAVLQWGDNVDTLPGSPHHQSAQEALNPLKAFHFPVRFPEVFRRDRSGFDVIVGNPPWEKAKLEEHEFWMRYHPGLRALSQREREQATQELKATRPELKAKLKEEQKEAERIRQLLTSGAFPGMGTGDPDLYKAFCWRFWNLARTDGGWLGVVLPRSAFAAKGSERFRKTMLDHDEIHDLTLLVNNRHWVFKDVHPQYTIGLLSLQREVPEENRTVALRGPFRSRPRFEYGTERPPVKFVAEQVEEWNDTAAFPLLPADGSAEVFAQIRQAPRLDLDDGESWRARPYAEVHATQDKELYTFTEEGPPGYWPVYKGESFDLWNPDTGVYYAWTDPESARERIQRKREWGANRSDSPWNEFPENELHETDTQPCHSVRIAFRDVSRATDTRTVRVALVPPRRFLNHKAPFFLWPRGDAKDQAYLLGVMSSIPYDWYMRRFVEASVTYHILNPSPVPRPDRANSRWQRVVEIAGTLATPDERFREWASAVGVEIGLVPDDQKEDLVEELDAVVAQLYGLSVRHVELIFETFHEGWDPTERLERTLAYYEEWE